METISTVTKGYKIFRQNKDNIKYLFHGINRSRIVPIDNTFNGDGWIEADKKIVSDGKGCKEYLSGFHFFTDEETAKKYLKRFKDYDDKVIVPVICKGIRNKPTNTEVLLADKMMINL